MEMKDKPVKVEAGWIILTILLLVGVLFMTYGHFQRSSPALITGLVVTAVGVLIGILRVVIYRKG